MDRFISIVILLAIVLVIASLIKKYDRPDDEEDDGGEEGLETDAGTRHRALEILLEHGYEILSMKEQIACGVQRDEDESLDTVLVADFTVRSEGKTYVVKVHPEDSAKPNLQVLRRELLPYYLLYRPHAVLYVDAEDETIQVIHFDIQKDSERRRGT